MNHLAKLLCAVTWKAKAVPKEVMALDIRHSHVISVCLQVKCLPVMRETWVQCLGQEDPLEKEMATHSSTLAWKIPWTQIFPVAQMVKNLPAMQNTQLQTLGQEDPLEKGMATYSSVLSWRIP